MQAPQRNSEKKKIRKKIYQNNMFEYTHRAGIVRNISQISGDYGDGFYFRISIQTGSALLHNCFPTFPAIQ